MAYQQCLEAAVLADASASRASGPSSTTSSRSSPTARRRASSTARSPRAPSASGSATACGCCPSRTTTRCAPPRRPRWSTSSRRGASSSAPDARPPASSSRRSASIPTRRAPMWEEALEVVVGAWTEDEFDWRGEALPTSRARARRSRSRCSSPTRRSGSRRRAPTSHELVGRKGLGLLSFTIGVPPEDLARRIALYRRGLAGPSRSGSFVNDRAATFTMVHCAETTARGRRRTRATPSPGTRRRRPADPDPRPLAAGARADLRDLRLHEGDRRHGRPAS